MSRWLGFAVLMVFSTNAVAGSVSNDLVTDTFATAMACYLFESDGADGFPAANLSPQQLAEAVRDYTPGQVFTDDEIEAFYWRAAVPAACEIHQDQKMRYGIYVLDEVLSGVGEVSGGNVGWSELRERATGDACGRIPELAERVDRDSMISALHALDEYLENHQVFSGTDAPADLAQLKVRWRAYWLGRYRERELSQQAVEDYAAAFEAFPEQGDRFELDFREMPLPLFYTAEAFSPERLAAFGSVSPGGDRGLDLESYIVRQQVWNYLFSGELDFPISAPDTDQIRALKDDLIRHLRGELPGPEACHPVDYMAVRDELASIQRQVQRFVDDHLRARLAAIEESSALPESERIEQGAPIASVVSPALANWDREDCVQPIVRARYIDRPVGRLVLAAEPPVSHTHFDRDSARLAETLEGVTLHRGVLSGLRRTDATLSAERVERIRRHDVVDVLTRTVLDRLDLVEIDVCRAYFNVPVMPGGHRVSVPSIQVREVERLWQR